MLKMFIKDYKTGIKKEIKMTRTLSGDYMLREHPDMDIVIMPQKNKILALSKIESNDRIYRVQDSLFDYMAKKGVITLESVRAGNVFGSLQAEYPHESPGGENVLQVVIYSIANFIEKERSSFTFEKEFEKEMEKQLLAPDVENSTELGEVPQEDFKGSIPKTGFPNRGAYRYNY